MKYKKEYIESKNREDFIRRCRENKEYKNIKTVTFQRKYYELKKKLPEIKKEPRKSCRNNGVDYEKIFKYAKDYKEFADRVTNICPSMKFTSAKRRYYDVRNKLRDEENKIKEEENKIKEEENKLKEEENKIKDIYIPKDEPPVERITHYLDSEKSKPSYAKMLELADMKKMYGKNISRDFLFKYGFSVLEINWLEDEGEINGN